MTYLVHVELKHACFGFTVENGAVTRMAPYTRKAAQGRTGRQLVAYWRSRGARVNWQEIEEDAGVRTIVVKNKKRDRMGPRAVYIGRGSAWGNPFATKASSFDVVTVATVEESITRYREHIQDRLYREPELRAPMDDLARRYQAGEDLELFCFCAPGPCHGDVLKQIVEHWPIREDAEDGRKAARPAREGNFR